MNKSVHKAIIDGREDEVKKLIKDGADINQLFGSRGTPLCAAISANRVRIVEFLLEAGCDVNMGDSDNEPPVCLAVRKQYVDIVKLLLQRKQCDINAIDPVTGQAPIHIAIQNGNNTIIDVILKTGRCLFNRTNSQNELPVVLAIKKTNFEAVKDLVNIGCALNIPNEQGDLPIHVAAALEPSEILELLLSQSHSPRTNSSPPLLNESLILCSDHDTRTDGPKLINRGHSKGESKTADKECVEIEFSLYDGAVNEVNNQDDCVNRNMVDISTNYGPNEEIHKQNQGLEKGDRNKSDTCEERKAREALENIESDAISYNSDSDTHEVLDILGKFPVDTLEIKGGEMHSWSPLDPDESEVIFKQNTDESERLGNVNSFNKVGRRLPIHIAADHQNIQNIICLIKHGADLNIPDSNGNTPLVYACVHDNLEIAETLLKAGADPNGCVNNKTSNQVMLGFTIPDSKTTALYAAIACKSDAIVDLLVSHGADLNIPHGEFSKQPLINYCLSRNRMDLAIKFLKYVPERLDLTATDKDGQNCLFSAIKCRQSDNEFIERLISLGVDINQPNRAAEYAVESCVTLERGDLIETLLKHGSYINRPDEDGCTALHLSAMQDDMDSTCLLMQYGADMRLAPSEEESIVLLAFEYNNIEMAFNFISEGYKADKDCLRVLEKIEAKRIIHDCFFDDEQLLREFAEVAMVPISLSLLCRNEIREHFIDNNLKYSHIYKLEAPIKLLDFISMKTNVWMNVGK